MNETMLRQAADERLLTAELAEVMADGVASGGGTRRSWRQLYVAALVLLGVAVTLGVAWLARAPDAMAQDPPFDPVDPWYEHEWPFRPGLGTAWIRSRRAEQNSPDAEEFVVTLRDENSTELAAVLDRPVVRRLALSWRNDAASANVADALWQRIATRPELESLTLAGGFGLSPVRLRELRRSPQLRYLMFLGRSAMLDLATVHALLELPRLRGLALAGVELTSEGLAALSGMPHLEVLMLSRPAGDVPALAPALMQLRSLRALVIEQDEQRPMVDGALLRALSTLPRLVALDMSFADLDDAALAALPPRLELLGLSGLDRCTPAGISSLRRLEKLRTLRLRAGVPSSLQSALLESMRMLPLARIDLLVGTLDTAVWETLHQQPGLRRLSLRPQGVATETVFRDARGCGHLEELVVHVMRLPRPDHLAPLRGHPTLRRIVLHNNELGGAPLDADAIAELRASVGLPIDVLPR